MIDIAKLLKENNLNKSTLLEIKQYFKLNPELYDKFNKFWKNLDPHYSKNIQYKVIHTIAAYPEFTEIEGLIIHINQFLIDSEGEVSPSKFVILNKINPEFNNIIINTTCNLPKKMTPTGRCELLRQGILELPKCANCENHVSWFNSSKLLIYCSKQCADNSKLTKEKRVVTMNTLYGSDSYTQTEEFKTKAKKTKKENYGNENYTNREQWTKTCLEKFGVRNQAQSPEIYKKIQKSLFTVKQYENTNLNYQGSYELYFLDLMNKRGLINEITTPQPFNYIINNNTYVYNPDFEFNGKIIEIKSSWTYNKNGADKELENKNHSKWNAVKTTGKEIIVLKSKKEIESFIIGL